MANKRKSFTLIEILVSVAIFSMVVLVVIGSLMNIIKAKQLVLQKTYLYDSGRFIMESIIREARVSKFDPSTDWNQFVFNHPVLGEIEYNFTASSASIHRIEQDGSDQIMNPPNVKIYAQFYDSVSCHGGYSCVKTQPMRTVILKVSDLKGNNEIILQSAVSRRELNL